MSNSMEQFGKYLLLEKLASGGMAEVYLSKSTGAEGVNKFVAIKRILPQFSDNAEFIDMFKEEAKITVNLNHSNVVSIYDFGVERKQFFLVMEYVEGKNLRQVLNEMKKTTTQFTIEQIVYMSKEIAAGLDHAHRCIDGTSGKPLNITHRDMSPQNVMVSFEGEVKIIDFGIAKAENQIEATKVGTLKGKYGYMSPEQAEGQIVDLRTDIFSLGIILWELLANDRLFTSNSEAAILRKIRDCQIPSIRKLNPSVPVELERIVNKALAKDKNLRYQTAAALHRDLNRFLNTAYPEFSPHDFSVFMKNTFSDVFLSQRKKLVEFAKVQSVNPSANNDNTIVTQTDARSTSESARMANPPPMSRDSEVEKLDIDTTNAVKVRLDDLKTKSNVLSNIENKTLSKATGSVPINTQWTSTGIGNTRTAIKKGPDFGSWALNAAIAVVFAVGAWILFKNFSGNKSAMSNLATHEMPLKNPGAAATSGSVDMAATAQYSVTIESTPPGARIYIDGADTGAFTPNRRMVTGNRPLAINLRKDGFLNYENNITVNSNAQSVKATLQPMPQSGFISVNLINGGANPILEVNGQRLNEKIPIERYTIPANVPVRVRAHNPYTGASAEQVVTIRENEKKNVELILK